MPTADLAIVWYVEPGESPSESASHELWLMDGGEILARSGAGIMACAILRAPALPTA